jgi:hypothetical protein
VQHRTHRRHGQVRLEVLLVVPHEGADPVVTPHAEPAQGVRQLGGAAAHLGVRRERAPSPVHVITSEDPCTVVP